MKTIRTKEGVSLPAIPFLIEYTEGPPEKHKPVLKDNQLGLRDCLTAFSEKYEGIERLMAHRCIVRPTAISNAKKLEELGLLQVNKIEHNRMQYRLTPKGVAEKALIMEKHNETIPE